MKIDTILCALCASLRPLRYIYFLYSFDKSNGNERFDLVFTCFNE